LLNEKKMELLPHLEQTRTKPEKERERKIIKATTERSEAGGGRTYSRRGAVFFFSKAETHDPLVQFSISGSFFFLFPFRLQLRSSISRDKRSRIGTTATTTIKQNQHEENHERRTNLSGAMFHYYYYATLPVSVLSRSDTLQKDSRIAPYAPPLHSKLPKSDRKEWLLLLPPHR
jgi:hypothetical protein